MATYFAAMQQFTAIVHACGPGEGGFWATCLEVAGANGQGETRGECLESLACAVNLLLELAREEACASDSGAQEVGVSVA